MSLLEEKEIGEVLNTFFTFSLVWMGDPRPWGCHQRVQAQPRAARPPLPLAESRLQSKS